MLWIKAFHIIAMVAWFSGLFYLPRLFVYHADCHDEAGLQRFVVMERKLYHYIMWPAAILTTVFGVALYSVAIPFYAHAAWMHLKLLLVVLVWVFHLYCGHFRRRFAKQQPTPSSKFFRLFNEVPTILLIAIVLLVVIRPLG